MSMQQGKVIFRMVAHNSEQTIAQAMESVLGQTYPNIELHVGIRASTDSTTDIVKKYAEKDSRIRVIINKQAFVYDEGNDITDYYHEYDITRDYVCFIDGDDEYRPEFAEKMVAFAGKYDLDIAACGCDIIDSSTGVIRDTQKADDIIIIEGDGFETDFQKYHRYMRSRWAKLFRLSVTAKLDRSRIFWLYYCDDAVETLEYYRNAGRVGIYPGSFYKWFYYKYSLSRVWDDRRINSDRVIYEMTEQYLLDKTGRISDDNHTYLLCAVYLGAAKETIDVLLGAPLPVSQILEKLHDIYTHEYTREAAELLSVAGSDSAVRAFINPTAGWISANGDLVHDEHRIKLLADILSVMEKLTPRL